MMKYIITPIVSVQRVEHNYRNLSPEELMEIADLKCGIASEIARKVLLEAR